MPWHAGPTLLGWLNSVAVPADPVGSFRMPVQSVNRMGADRLYAGTVAAGRISVEDEVAISGSPPSRVARVLGPDGDQHAAEAGDAVALQLADQRDIGRGAMLSASHDPAPVADQFQARLIWCDDAPLLPGRTYLVKLGASLVSGSVSRIRHAIDVDTGLPLSARTLHGNDIGSVNLSLATPVPFERFADCKALGGFILIDRQTNATAGVGTIEFALTRSSHLAWQHTAVGKEARADMLRQRPMVVWLTGLSGAGKSTIASLVESRLHAQGRHTYLIDGDNVRHGLCRDLGFTEADRVENIRRVSEVAALMVDAGLIVLVCLISPYAADRDAARERVGPGEFLEVFVDAPLEECRRRDPKGLYAKADQGVIPNFTGVTAPYEPPPGPDIHIRSDRLPPGAAADMIVRRLL
jgi:bifunctional enzyme CysN/CysC